MQRRDDGLALGADNVCRIVVVLIVCPRCRAADSIHSKCRQWLDDLPADVVVEPVKTNVDGHDLSSVREQIKVAKDELAQLRGLPTVPADIESRVRTYVESLGKPTISGLGKSELPPNSTERAHRVPVGVLGATRQSADMRSAGQVSCATSYTLGGSSGIDCATPRIQRRGGGSLESIRVRT
jgi:hypothetical protein